MTAVQSSQLQQQRLDSSEVGWLFVQQYYTLMNREPDRLHCFYNKKSSFLHGNEGDQVTTCYGQQEIHQRILDMGLNNCRVLVSNVDTQASLNNGIMIQVLGEMSNNGGTSHKFAQTFFLAEQPNGYYVLNDIFRFLKEDIDNHYDEGDSTEPVVQEQFVDSSKNVASASAPVPATTSQASANVATKSSGFPADLWKTTTPVAVNGTSSTSTMKQLPADQPAKTVEQVKKVAPASPVKELNKEAVVSKPITVVKSAPSAKPVPQASEENPAQSVAPEIKKSIEKPVETKAPVSQKVSNPELSKQDQKPATPQTISSPPKQKTWANLAATNVDKFANELSPAKGQVLNSAQPAKSGQKENKKQSNNKSKEPSSSDNSNANNTNEGSGEEEFKPVSNRRPDSKRNSDSRQHEEKEKYSIYIKGLAEGTTQKMISEVCAKFGAVRSVDILANRNIAFVEFEKTEFATKAIGQTVVINGATVLAEERRKNKSNNDGNKQNQRRDRKDYKNKQNFKKEGQQNRPKSSKE